jgi:hypothetical protein
VNKIIITIITVSGVIITMLAFIDYSKTFKTIELIKAAQLKVTNGFKNVTVK